MAIATPETELQISYSDQDAEAVPWSHGRNVLDRAEVYWISTVRPDGRPHVTPMIGIWLDEALHFTTGPEERKARNLEHNQHCVITTGCNAMESGFDVIVEGDAHRVTDASRLQRLAGAYHAKYGWDFTPEGDGFRHEGGVALVFAVAPVKAFGYGRDGEHSATRWRFG